jgi:lysophospholipase L1-like esterase
VADPRRYLLEFASEALRTYPDSHTLTIACHGHSVPAGYFATPLVDTFSAYPHQWHRRLKERFPSAVINVITTAIGGEDSERGAARFARDVLTLRPDLVTIDYGINDRGIGLSRARSAWHRMIDEASRAGSKLILLTPTWDIVETKDGVRRDDALSEHAALIRELAADADVGLADPFHAFEHYLGAGGYLTDLLSWPNHPNARGHALVADELMRWFPLVLPAASGDYKP